MEDDQVHSPMTSMAAGPAALSTACAICANTGGECVYDGPIRAGRFGSLTSQPYRVIRCNRCGVDRLDPVPHDAKSYESGAYRAAVDGESSVAAYRANHDKEVASRLSLVGIEAFRRRVVADIGCGGGSFLDAILGVALQTIGVEPQAEFGDALRSAGHRHYAYTGQLATDRPSSVDVAVCFQVIEHVPQPRSFLTEIAACLRPGSVLHLTTPNRDEILMQLGPQSYRRFFYRLAHLWYFNVQTLTPLAVSAGFEVLAVTTPHAFDLGNFVLWLREGRPAGTGAVPALNGPVDAAYRAHVAQSGAGSTIYAQLRRL